MGAVVSAGTGGAQWLEAGGVGAGGTGGGAGGGVRTGLAGGTPTAVHCTSSTVVAWGEGGSVLVPCS